LCGVGAGQPLESFVFSETTKGNEA